MELYTVKFNNGSANFEISAPNQAWVDEKLTDLKKLLAAPTAQPRASTHQTDVIAQKTVNTPRSRKKTTTKTDEVNSVLSGALNEELINNINAFVDGRSKAFSKGATKQAAILAVFLKDSLGIELISSTDLEFIYRKIGWDTINHVAQLNNARTRDKFFVQTQGKLELTHNGLKFGRDTSKDSGANEDAA